MLPCLIGVEAPAVCDAPPWSPNARSAPAESLSGGIPVGVVQPDRDGSRFAFVSTTDRPPVRCRSNAPSMQCISAAKPSARRITASTKDCISSTFGLPVVQPALAAARECTDGDLERPRLRLRLDVELDLRGDELLRRERLRRTGDLPRPLLRLLECPCLERRRRELLVDGARSVGTGSGDSMPLA